MSSSNSKSGIKNIPAPEGSKTSTYGRFIPREEINSFEAWAPQNIGSHQTTPKTPTVPARKTDPAQNKGVNTTEDFNLSLQKARQEAWHEGYASGMNALEHFKQDYAAKMGLQVGSIIEALNAQLDDLQQDMARAITMCATGLARQTIRSELEYRPALIAQVATEALESLLSNARHIVLHLHPNDVPWITQGSTEILSSRGVRLVADTSITQGGCMVVSDIGMIDATLETRWRRAIASIGCHSEWKPSLADSQTGGVENENQPQRDPFLPNLQPMAPKSDSLPGPRDDDLIPGDPELSYQPGENKRGNFR